MPPTTVPYVDTRAKKRFFGTKSCEMLLARDKITAARVERLLSWQHSGFNVHRSAQVASIHIENNAKLFYPCHHVWACTQQLVLFHGGSQISHVLHRVVPFLHSFFEHLNVKSRTNLPESVRPLPSNYFPSLSPRRREDPMNR